MLTPDTFCPLRTHAPITMITIYIMVKCARTKRERSCQDKTIIKMKESFNWTGSPSQGGIAITSSATIFNIMSTNTFRNSNTTQKVHSFLHPAALSHDGNFCIIVPFYCESIAWEGTVSFSFLFSFFFVRGRP
jgi:hypothetical protein